MQIAGLVVYIQHFTESFCAKLFSLHHTHTHTHTHKHYELFVFCLHRAVKVALIRTEKRVVNEWKEARRAAEQNERI